MATVTYNLRVTVGGYREAKTLTESDKKALFKRPELETKKTKRPGNVTRAKVSVPETSISDQLTLEDLDLGYEELIQRADTILEILKERGKGLTYEFEPKDKPDLSQAVSDIFTGESRRITYNMYLACLRLDKDISIAIGEESHGFK